MPLMSMEVASYKDGRFVLRICEIYNENFQNCFIDVLLLLLWKDLHRKLAIWLFRCKIFLWFGNYTSGIDIIVISMYYFIGFWKFYIEN